MFDTIPYYIEQLLGFLTSPWAAVFIIVGFGIVLVLMNVPSAKWWVISFLLYSTTFGVSGLGATENAFATGTAAVQRLAFPLNIVQTNARMLTILCLLFMLLPTLAAAKGRRISLVTGAFVSLFLLEMWVCVRLSLGLAAVLRSSLDFVVALLMLTSITVGVGRWLQTSRDVRALLKAFVGFGILFVLGNIYQILMVPSTLHQPRLAGTTPSAQSVGQVSALIIVPALFLAQDKLVSRQWRFGSLVVAGATTLMLLWSGSRTGMAMTVAGLLCMFGARLHRFIIPAIGLVIALYVGSLLLPQAFAGVTRFTDTSDDRTAAWSWMIAEFLQNPVVGITSSGMGYRESFFLATFAYYGAIGAVPMLMMIVLTVGMLLRLVRQRILLGVDASLLRILTAMFAMLSVAAMFEASLLGLLNAVTMTVYLTFTMLAFCRDEVTLNQYAPAYETDPYATPAYGAAPAFSDLSWY